MTLARCLAVLALRIAAVVLVAAPPAARADAKEACVDAHGRGQDLRDQGKLSLARKQFMTCAQASCPALVQGDCARLADDLVRLQPTIGFVSRDDLGGDLPDTKVYVDDTLVATRLDDGKLHDVDPGRRVVRFVHRGKEQLIPVVIGAGEKARMVSVTFGRVAPPHTGRDRFAAGDPAPAPAPPATRPFGAKLAIGIGAALLAGGAGFAAYGFASVPDRCTIGTGRCAAPPGDPAFADAGRAMQLANVGLVAGGFGAAVLVGGVVWYVTGKRAPGERAGDGGGERVVAPFVTSEAAGLAIVGRL